MEVEDILEHRTRDGHLEYLVKWKHFPVEASTWEKEAQFDTPECIDEYWDKLAQQDKETAEWGKLVMGQTK